jgi:hypothetical protein
MMIKVDETPSVCNEMRSARIAKFGETQAQFLLKQRSRPAKGKNFKLATPRSLWSK